MQAEYTLDVEKNSEKINPLMHNVQKWSDTL